MRPRVARILEASWMAWAKSPVISVRAATNRLPKLWPLSASPPRKRWVNSWASRSSSWLRAIMQLRRSPGGSMLKPMRNRPEEPPSSVTVTTAARSEINPGWAVGVAGVTCSRRPRSNVESPVPPPMATTRNESGGAGVSATLSERCLAGAISVVNKFKSRPDGINRNGLNQRRRSQFEKPLRDFRIQQLGEAGIVHHALKVVIRTRLEAISRVQLDRSTEIGQAVMGAAGDGVEQGEAVKGVV